MQPVINEKNAQERIAPEIKLIALDMDDTLLSSDLTVSARNRQAISQAQAQGVKVMIATGRMYCSALPFAESLQLSAPIIAYNGGLIKDRLTAAVLWHLPVPAAMAQKVLQLCREKDWYIQSYVDDALYVKEIDYFASYYARVAGVQAIPIGAKLYELTNAPTKMLAMTEAAKMPAMQAALQAEFGSQLNFSLSKPTYLEITNPAVNKGAALAKVAEYMGIARESVMAMGDSGNDIDMISYAGWGVAMGNAAPAVKAAARLLAESHAEDGVAKIIENYVLR